MTSPLPPQPTVDMPIPAPKTAPPPLTDNQISIMLTIISAGLALFALGGWMIYESLGLFALGLGAWSTCLSAEGGALIACSGAPQEIETWRFGWQAGTALTVGILLAFVGPVPLIVILSRFQLNWVSAILLLVVMIPYGLLAFLLLIMAALAIVFYGAEVF